MVDILLATYNGEKYLEEQLESIRRQSFRDWTLHVHDDGSTDRTMDIIRGMASDDERIIIHEDGVVLHSPGRNFLHLLQYSTAPFIMFCDQDDIWFEDKVEKMYRAISATDNSIPEVVYSNAAVWNPSDGIKGPSTLYFAHRLEDLLFLNSGVQGASAIFNAKARGMMREFPMNGDIAMHDHLLQLICVCFGMVSVIDESLMYYREHPLQATGSTKTSILSPESFFSRTAVLDRKHFNAVREFRDCYSYALDKKTGEILDEFDSMEGKSLFGRLISIKSGGYTLYGSRTKLIIKLLIRPFISKQ